MPAVEKARVEQSLSDLAIAEVGSKLPKLMQHLVGFEVIECNDEATRAAGILAFDLGGGLVYSPVLFLNGRIKAATDILYLSDADVFTSATPAWVEYLASRGAGVTGEAKTPPAGAGAVPSEALRIFNRPPQVGGGAGKYASFQSDWGSRSKFAAALPCEFRELFAWWTRPQAIQKDAAFEGRFTVANALRSLGPRRYGAFIGQLTEEFPEVLEKYAQFHDLNELRVSFSDEEIAAANPLPKAAALAVPTLSFVDHAALDEYPDAFDALQKQAVLETGLAVIDKRAAKDKSRVFEDDYAGKFCTPTESGFHEIFNDQGELEKVYIGLNPFFLDKPNKKLPVPMIVDAKGGGKGDYYLPKDGEGILCRSRLPLEDEDFKKRFDQLTPLEDAGKTGDEERYIAISPSGVASAPFEVRHVIRKDGLTTLAVHTDDDMERRLLVPPSGAEAASPDSVTFIRLVDAFGERESIRALGGMVFVPKTYRVMRVKKLAADDLGAGIRPGGLGLLGERTSRDMGLRAVDAKKEAAGRFVLRQTRAGDRQAEAISRPLNKHAALKLLIGNLHFDEADARALLGDAESIGAGRRWFLPPATSKLAQLLPGTPFPVHDEYHDFDERGRPVQQPSFGASEIPQDRLPVPGPDDQPDGPGRDPAADALGSGFQRTDRSNMDLVMRAAEGGEEVFDPAMIGSILKTNRTQAQLDSWIPDLSGALDRLCRTTLLFWWKNGDFGEMYGKNELSLLEDLLLEGVKNLGEIVLFLKQRAAESSDTQTDAIKK
jgi:hypothetical protein